MGHWTKMIIALCKIHINFLLLFPKTRNMRHSGPNLDHKQYYILLLHFFFNWMNFVNDCGSQVFCWNTWKYLVIGVGKIRQFYRLLVGSIWKNCATCHVYFRLFIITNIHFSESISILKYCKELTIGSRYKNLFLSGPRLIGISPYSSLS